MISVEEAKDLVLQNTNPILETISIQVSKSLGYCIAQDIFAPLNLPPFNQSNVDGYAVKFNSTNTWKVIQESKAGDATNFELNVGDACRIFTGAMVPKGADAVIMQENCVREKDLITCVNNFSSKLGEHIRLEGEEIKKGDLAILKNTNINPSVISFLASMGLQNISVYKQPSVVIIVTGNELQQAGEALQIGKVYDSNSHTLTAALQFLGINDVQIYFANDDKNSLKSVVEKALFNTDVLLLSGGISVGDYDFVEEVLQELKVEKIFYKVAQKPGKPLFFGKNKKSLVFALPGNPASTLTCFYEYVFPAIKKMQGKSNLFLQKQTLPITQSINKTNSLANFLKAKVFNSKVEPLTGQQSFMMKSFAQANAFIYLPAQVTSVQIGDEVEVHLLPEN
ncbi:MAG: gephyrin-like molybdotransferase Glp [Bacteroidota bacterium]